MVRPIEMQMSIPRSQDASSVHHQTLHKPFVDQTLLAEQATRKTEQLRSKNTQVDETVQLPIHEEEQRHKQSSERNKHKRKLLEGSSEQDTEVPIHPYKGHRIDLTL